MNEEEEEEDKEGRERRRGNGKDKKEAGLGPLRPVNPKERAASRNVGLEFMHEFVREEKKRKQQEVNNSLCWLHNKCRPLCQILFLVFTFLSCSLRPTADVVGWLTLYTLVGYFVRFVYSSLLCLFVVLVVISVVHLTHIAL